MIGTSRRTPLHRFMAVLGALAVAGVAVLLPSSPAHAAYVNQGTFQIKNVEKNMCIGVADNSTADGAFVHLEFCNASAANQQWKVYAVTDVGNFQINAYGGAWPLNKCLDLPESNNSVTIYRCHGGSQQRFEFQAPEVVPARTLKQSLRNNCVFVTGFLGGVQQTAGILDCTTPGVNLQWSFIRIG